MSGCPDVHMSRQWRRGPVAVVSRAERQRSDDSGSLQRDTQPAGDMPSHEVTSTVLHLTLLNILLRIHFLQLSNQHFSGVLLPLSSWCLVY